MFSPLRPSGPESRCIFPQMVSVLAVHLPRGARLASELFGPLVHLFQTVSKMCFRRIHSSPFNLLSEV